jgi:hypothetical protein
MSNTFEFTTNYLENPSLKEYSDSLDQLDQYVKKMDNNKDPYFLFLFVSGKCEVDIKPKFIKSGDGYYVKELEKYK